jgi:hypothetical protein
MPADAGGDVKNLPPGTRVRLPDGRMWSGNDSYWMDLGFPDQVGPDGKRFRPLFAFFITDLDGRVNLNVHGNIRGDGNQHVSNMGFGPWEVNLEKVLLDKDGVPTGETPAVFLGTGPSMPAPFQMQGRYGVGPDDKGDERCAQCPAARAPIVPRQPPFYSLMDWDGCRDFAPPDLTYQKSDLFFLPGQKGKSLGYDRFPRFWRGDPPALGGGVEALGFPRGDLPYYTDRENEFMFHPMAFSPFEPAPGNRTFGAWNLDALLRHGDTGADAMVSDLRRLLPKAFSNPGVRQLVTTHSADVAWPGTMPWDDGLTKRLRLVSSNPLVLAGEATTFLDNPPLSRTEKLAVGYQRIITTDFTTAWQDKHWHGPGGRIDLSRTMPDYPPIDPQTGQIPTSSYGLFLAAQKARQDFAEEIFNQLLNITGVFPPLYLFGPIYTNGLYLLDAPHSTPDIGALRALAQIAVNIVDYLDNDDYITPYNWGKSHTFDLIRRLDGSKGVLATLRDEWVYGTELPRLVVNEAYVEHAEPVAGQETPVNVWVELCNPLHEDKAMQADFFRGLSIQDPDTPGAPGTRGGLARLQMRPSFQSPGYPIYQVVLTRKNEHLLDAGNVRGAPDRGAVLRRPWNSKKPPKFDVSCIVNDFTDPDLTHKVPWTEWVYTAGNHFGGVNGQNYGFYLLGPIDNETGNALQVPGAGLRNTLSRREMQFAIPPDAPKEAFKPTILLRRLACPHLPPNPDTKAVEPGDSSPYNPYVTIDYMEDVFDNLTATPPGQRFSVGRRQPYASSGGSTNAQVSNPPQTDHPQNTFFQHNLDAGSAPIESVQLPDRPPRLPYFPANFKPAFNWLVHLDRAPISPMELLHVSAYKPHELTERFAANGNLAAHYVPWLEERSRLFRLFEYLTCRPRMAGLGNISVTGNPAVKGGKWSDITLSGPDEFFQRSGEDGALGKHPPLPGNVASWSIDGPWAGAVIDAGTPREEVISGVTYHPNTDDPHRVWFFFTKDHAPDFRVSVPIYGVREPGKININTIWDIETFRALCDAQPCNGFYGPNIRDDLLPDNTVDSIFHLLRDYDPIMSPGGWITIRPFWSFGVGLYDTFSYQWLLTGLGIGNTLLASRDFTNWASRADPTKPRVFEVENQDHPYRKYELLTKIYNNITVRSNVFAVWCTTGYFEVDDQGRLGEEIGRADGKQVRHRFFAIVDRSPLEPWVRLERELCEQTPCRYDVAQGAVPTIPTDPRAPPPAPPLIGNQRWDPRRDYSQTTVFWINTGLKIRWPTGPPATVLYSTVIK